MIDFVRLREAPTALFSYLGEVEYKYKYIISNNEIKTNEKTVLVEKSRHGLHNVLQWKDVQNYNDFRYSALCSTINNLTKRTDLRKNRFTQLEFGLNIKLPKPYADIIKQNIILHKLKSNSDNEKLDSEGKHKKFDYSNYYFKIYMKATELENDHIIRFEIKHKNSKVLRLLGVSNLDHLKSKALLRSLFDDLLKRFDELTIVDSLSTDSKISNKDKRKLQAYSSDYFWGILSENRNLRDKEKKSFQSLLVKNDLLKTKTFLRTSLIQKFEELLNS
jgi:hypothetical protein